MRLERSWCKVAAKWRNLFRSAKCKVQSTKWQQVGETFLKYEVHSARTKYKVQSTKCKVQSAKCKVQSAKYKVQSTKYKVQSAKCKVQSAKWRKIALASSSCTCVTHFSIKKRPLAALLPSSKMCRWLIMRPDKVAMGNFVQSLWSQHAAAKSDLKPRKEPIKILVAQVE